MPDTQQEIKDTHDFAPRVHYGPLWETHMAEAVAGEASPIAVLVCHGMGEQVRYETISSVANAICKEAEKRGAKVQPINVRLCSFGDEFLARAEVSWKDADSKPHSAHVYEAYWAPLTEGQVTYRDTLKFLFLAAWNGLRYSRPFVRSSFLRWMFGDKKKMDIGRITWFGIISVLLFVIFQVAIIAYVAVELGKQYSTVVARTPDLAQIEQHFWSSIGYWLEPFIPGIRPLLRGDWWPAAFFLLAWIAMIVGTFGARYFLSEYVGDVAAYVSPYKDSKFDELRSKIQAVGLHVGKILYGFAEATTSPVPRYRNIVVVGHSLGSVLAYDTLNALINLDTASAHGQARDVVQRTRALITFGSPLDKTAFIFRMQASSDQDWIREQLAASVQPLIVDYGFRPDTFRWINIWSSMDIISGALDYYDDPAVPASDPRHVQNVIDPKARIPLFAHVQYWNNPLLREKLYDCMQ